MNFFSIIFVFTFLVSFSRPVQLPGESSGKQTISKKSDNINHCLKPDRPSPDLLSCFGNQMLEKMQDLEESEVFNLVDGVTLKRDEAGPRDISNYLDKNPLDFR